MTERAQTVEVATKREIRALTFAANGEYLVSGGRDAFEVLRVKDGKRVATMTARHVLCLAVSNDGGWIAAGTFWGEVTAWDAKTYKQVFSHKEDYQAIHGIDFSPDSTRLVAASASCVATVWEVATRKRVVCSLRHEDWVTAAKYSPQGDRIATATPTSVQVYDSNDGHLLLEITATATPSSSTRLLWSNDQLFVLSDGVIKRVEASTGSAVSEWAARGAACIALPRSEAFIVYAAHHTVTILDASTHSLLALIHHSQEIRSIALSPDDKFLAIGGKDGKIIIKSLSRITDSIPLSHLHPTFKEPCIQIDTAVLDSWMHGELEHAEQMLTVAIPTSQNPLHHVLASRAIVRGRLGQWDAAIDDAKQSIKIQPSALGYIAKSIALVGMGARHEGYRACDIAFEQFHSDYISFLLLVKAIVVFMAGEHDDAISRVDDLLATAPLNSTCHVIQAYMYLLLGNLRLENSDYNGAIQLFECAQAQMQLQGSRLLSMISLISGWQFDDLGIIIQQRLCEALYRSGRTTEGGEALLEMVSTFEEHVYTNESIIKWVSGFTQQCLSTSESTNDAASKAPRDVIAGLSSSTPTPLLKAWAKATLATNSWKNALDSPVSFMLPRSMIYQVICEHLELLGHIMDASECLRQMVEEMAEQTNTRDSDDRAGWVFGFRRYCSEKLEGFGDAAMSEERYGDAIFQYSAALSLCSPSPPQGLYIKRSMAYTAKGSWEDALNDANKAIALDPLSPWGYESKHAALHKAKDYENAIHAFEVMLSKILHSDDIDIQERRYINPSETRVAIRKAIQDSIRGSPHMLINTISGRLFNKSEQATAFESLPVFNELISSMTTHIDHARIEHDVVQYYRYATFSHKWDYNEPLFETVIHITVYDLEESPTNNKLQMFCKVARDVGLHWAWSDTCCINKSDHFMLQEALVSMFQWYERSAMTVVHLLGVCSPSQCGDLMKSIWNTRAWTFQEYHASKVIIFYNEDWTLYRSLDVPNHKDSPEIISEMEQATGVSARALIALRPGLNDVREKLRLASTRQTTRVEDAAYSLLGIFSMSLPVMYGEGDKALGRLLAQVLTSSGDTSILAWTGQSGGFNSCLPVSITVFNKLPSSHIPPAMEAALMESVTTVLRTSSLNSALVMKLYDRLHELPIPFFAGQRMKLPCITFTLGPVAATRSASGRVFRAKTDALGIVEIATTEDLTRLESLIFVHPWIDFLLDRQPVAGIANTISEENTDVHSHLIGEPSLSGPVNITPAAKQSRALSIVARLARPFATTRFATPRDTASLLSPSPASPADKQMQALQLIVRLRQPFGALLFTPTRQNAAEYRRVASESMITVRVREDVPLNLLIDNTRMLDVL